MRKTVIALILILPLLFVFVVFSSVNMASLGVAISANGIKIANKSEFENETIEIDLADEQNYSLKVEVSPDNATNKDYTFEVEPVEGSNFADVKIDRDTGEITAASEGAAKIYAVSNDGGYRDGVTVLVSSSAAYDFDFVMTDTDGNSVLRLSPDGNYTGNVQSGAFSYDVNVKPSDFTISYVEPGDENTFAEIEEGSRKILLPFSGPAVLKVVVPDGVNGDIVKTVNLNVSKPRSSTGIIINGQADGTSILLEKGAKSASFYVESSRQPSLETDMQGVSSVCRSLGNNRYAIDVNIDGVDDNNFAARVVAGDFYEDVSFNFADFDFNLHSAINIKNENGALSTCIQRRTSVVFYAVPVVPATDITFAWRAEGASNDILTVSQDTKSCKVLATDFGEFTLIAEAYRGNEIIPNLCKQIDISVIARVNGIYINNKTDTDLAARYTVGGKIYSGDTLAENRYLIDVLARNIGGGAENAPNGLSDLEYSISDESIAELAIENGKAYLVPRGNGEVTTTFSWKGNETFGANIRASLTVNVADDAVSVSDAPTLVKAVDSGYKVALTDNIMLGTNADGTLMSKEAREQTLLSNKLKSTYNVEWYKNTVSSDRNSDGEQITEKDAYVTHVLEFKNDVYGNGFSINAENYTNAKDGTGQPLFKLYRGPLYFVRLQQLASVAGQDNCAFLVRTDGVKLYGVNLLGCNDSSLYNVKEDGTEEYDVNRLNLVGTTLEVNADAEIINCRISNGRNVVRVYGGNKDGENYFIDRLSENNGCDDERINVKIDGCVIRQAREFLLKIGANRALRSSVENGGEQPRLKNASGVAYMDSPVDSNYYDLLNDDYFYSQYVLTDVVLRNSVLETSGLFPVGVESNFAGNMLYERPTHEFAHMTGSWIHSGGTSFASVLRLQGDVRLYDWKEISKVDSSTLIESGIQGDNTEVEDVRLRLNIQKMFEIVYGKDPDEYGKLICERDGKKIVHAGIAYYGGGRNYSQISLEGLDSAYSDLSAFNININVLAGSELDWQGRKLPLAAGTTDFRFYMYDSDSPNSYEKQLEDARTGAKYKGIEKLNVF